MQLPSKIKLIIEPRFDKSTTLVIADSKHLKNELKKKLEQANCEIINDVNHSADYVFYLKDDDGFLRFFKKNNQKFRIVILLEQTSNHYKKIKQRAKHYQGLGYDIRILTISKIAHFQTNEIVKRLCHLMFGAKTQTEKESLTKQQIVRQQTTIKDLRQNKDTSQENAILFKQPFIYKALNRPRLWTLMLVFFIISIIFSPFAFTLLNIISVSEQLKNLYQDVRTSEFKNFANQITKIKPNIDKAQSSYSLIRPVLLFVNQSQLTDFIDQLINLETLALNSLEHTYKLYIFIAQSRMSLFSQNRIDNQISYLDQLPQINQEIDYVDKNLALIQAGLSQIQNYPIPPFFSEISQTISNTLKDIPVIRENLRVIKKIALVAPSITGKNEKRTYLILFQNNMELRPAGGFIGSFGILTFNNGYIDDFLVYDVYTADGNLKGHVDPPLPIRKYLNQPHFYLRDSNWHPDFAKSAIQAEWFFQKELGQQVDGVLSIDLNFLQSLLDLINGVYLPDYQETITAKNLYLKTQFYSERDFFPGSTKKRDFLSLLAKGIIDKLFAEGSYSPLILVKTIKDSLEEKHIQIYVHDNLVQSLLEEEGWAGRQMQIACKNAKLFCIADYLSVIDANLGVNKVNYYIKREEKFQLNILDDDTIENTVNINYQNLSPGTAYPGGHYKNYLRIYLPAKSKVKSLYIDNVHIDNRSYDLEIEGDKQAMGFFFEIAPQKEKRIQLNYSPEQKAPKKEFIYQLLVQKQAGTDKEPFSFNIVPNKVFAVIDTNFHVDKSNKVFYNTDLLVDRVFVVQFSTNQNL